MRIVDTELDYEEYDAVALDHYMGEVTETKENWAQRVWDCCRRQSEGEDISRVYKKKDGQTWQERAKELWENKKMRRAIALCFEFGVKEEPSEEVLMKIKDDPNYKTRDEQTALAESS